MSLEYASVKQGQYFSFNDISEVWIGAIVHHCAVPSIFTDARF